MSRLGATGDEGGIAVDGSSTLILDASCCFCCQVIAWFSVISALYTELEVPWAEELGPWLYDDDDVVVVETCTLILDSLGDIDGVVGYAVEDAEVEGGYIGNVAPAAV